MYITKKIKTMGISALAVTMIASMSMVAFASSTSSKSEPAMKLEAGKTENLDNVDRSNIKYEVAKESEVATRVNPDQISIRKSGEGIEIKKTTTENLDNVDRSEIKYELAKKSE
jgi:hypothetical protein